MPAEVVTKKQLHSVLEELRDIKSHLQKLLFLIPKDSLREYDNQKNIKKAYRDAVKSFPPR